jgi:hypothetical protein
MNVTQCPPETQQANLFELQGYDLQITYSTTSFSGEPQFTLISNLDDRTFSGDAVQIEETGLGQMVTVQLKANQADEGLESLTLLVPAVQLTAEAQAIAIQTLVIFSKQAVFVAPIAQQLQSYHPVYLSGMAKVVSF